MPKAIAPSIPAFLEHEATLRAQHGPGALYVRPQVYRVPSQPDAFVAIGGWAYFDGEPAIVPEGLHLLVITDEGPDGQPRRLGREPAAVMALLAPYTTRFSMPCPHFAVSVPPGEVDRIRARVAALPEHDPLAVAAPPAPPAPPADPGLAAGIPHPADVIVIDAEAKQINAVVLVAGSGAKRFTRRIFAATGGAVSGPPRDTELEHYVLRLGDMRGWQTRLLFYAGDDSLRSLEVAASMAPHAAVVVLAQDGAEARLEPGLAVLARAPRGPEAVVAFVGPSLAAEAWARVAGAPAAIVAPLDDATMMDTLKAITKALLANLRAP
jgi:hypothetical protein